MKTYFGSSFEVNKFSALDGKTTITYSQVVKHDKTPFTIKVNQSGMTFEGQMEGLISSTQELEGFAQLIADAWKSHLTLMPKISTSFSGH